MIKIKTFDRIIGRSQKRISQQEKKSIKNTINMIFKIINPVIYSEFIIFCFQQGSNCRRDY